MLALFKNRAGRACQGKFSNQNPFHLIERILVVSPVMEPGGLGAGMVGHLLNHFEFSAITQIFGDPGGPKRVAANVFGGCTDPNCPHEQAFFTDREIENISHVNRVLAAIGKDLNQIARNLIQAKLLGLPLSKNDILTFHGISELKSKIVFNSSFTKD